MTATITTSAFECGGAQIRSHFRHLATIVTIDGVISALNADRLSEGARRFVLAKDPLVLDLSNVNSFAAEGISFLDAIGDDCRTAGVEWMLVPSPAVTDRLRDTDTIFPIARSVPEVLHDFADVIDTRRQLLLPLVRKTA
jgi:anti-anti-sigma regulatory factor